MKKLLSLAVGTFLTISLAFFDAPAQTKKPAKTPAATTGVLYKISGRGLKKPSYLFGTIHIICQKDMFSMEKLTSFIDQTQQLVMEIDMDDPAEMQSLVSSIMIPNGKTFTEFLTPEEYAKVDEFIKISLGVSVENVKIIKPVMLGAMLMSNPKVLGCSSPTSYELSFMQIAAAKHKSITGLESVKFQAELLDKIPLEKQAKDLYRMAQDPQKTFDEFKKLMAAYKTQDSAALNLEIEKQTAASRDFAADLIDARNRSWIPRIEKAIRERSSFIAVGGGHLGGTGGVIKLLKAKGYIVQPVKL